MQHKNNEYFKKIEAFIDTYRRDYGTSPTNRMIAEGTGLSPATVSRYLQFMKKNGMLTYDGHRNIQTRKYEKDMESNWGVPKLGQVACGLPQYAEENIEEYVRLPVSIFGKGDLYILEAKGESMVEAGIDDGDLVVIRRQDTAETGQIIVALVEDEATLKRYYPEPKNHRVRLHPENSTMDDIYVDSCIIQGIAVHVINDLENR